MKEVAVSCLSDMDHLERFSYGQRGHNVIAAPIMLKDDYKLTRKSKRRPKKFQSKKLTRIRMQMLNARPTIRVIRV